MANGIYGAMIELQTINYVFQQNSIQLFILNNITPEHFTTYKPHYIFIMQFYDKYGMLPSKETFQGKFSDSFEWIDVTDPESYLVDKLNEAKLFREIIVDYKELGELIKSEQSDKAVERMASISQRYLKQKQSSCIDLISDAHIRYEKYIERVNNPDKAFVSTGLTELDDIIGGWDVENESAVICARTGFGKSWWLIYFALQAAKQGRRVGFYSGEMELDLVGYRLDTFLGNIPNGSLTHGNEGVQEIYENYIETINKIIPGHIYCVTPDDFDGSVTVTKIRAFIEKFDIDFMCIDQFSLLTDERGARTPREQAINLSKDLRSLQRLKKIPFLSAVQLNREDTAESGGPTTRNISESDRIGQDSSNVIFIERLASEGQNVRLTIGKSRNARTGDKLTYFWDINRGILRYIPTENDARSGRGAEDAEQSYNDSGRSDSVF